MPVSDEDLELLEAYLDGELPGSEGDALIDRLRTEPALASAVATLRDERAARATAWLSYEPSQDSVDRLIGRVERKVDNHYSWSNRLSKLRIVSGVAACILVGVFMGYAGRGRNQPNLSPGQGAVAQGTSVITAGTSSNGSVEVPIVDEYGRIVAVQRFASAGEAQQFVEEMRQFQQKQEQIHAGENIVPVNGKF